MPALGECLARSDELGCFTTVAMSYPIKNFQWLPEASRVINSALRLLLPICPKPHFPLNFTSSNHSFPLQVAICSSKKKKKLLWLRRLKPWDVKSDCLGLGSKCSRT